MKTFFAYIAATSRAIKSMDRGDWVIFAHAVSVVVYIGSVIAIIISGVTR